MTESTTALVRGDSGPLGLFEADPLPAEIEEGNCEYKLTLVAPDRERFAHLVTQLKWRLGEGHGEAIYEIGFADDGTPVGLGAEELAKSLETLDGMAKELHASISVLRRGLGKKGEVAEVLVRQFSDDDYVEVRVAVCGNVDAGKSTLVGVLTKGHLDNGRGSARQQVFRHKHEIETGRTSSISQQILGFDTAGRVMNYTDEHLRPSEGDQHSVRPLTWSEIVERSSKVLTFFDLAGHERYLKTTVFGLTANVPDYAMVLVGSNMGVSRMTKEHLGVTISMKIPVFIVVTKVDICPEHVLKQTLKTIEQILKSPGARKIPFVVKDKKDVVTCAKALANCESKNPEAASQARIAPIFLVSSVTGDNLDLLRIFLNVLPVRCEWAGSPTEPARFHIDDTFNVAGVGTVVSGIETHGTVEVNDTLLLGPSPAGDYIPVQVKSIHLKQSPVTRLIAGHTGSFALKKIKRSQVRKGMVLVHPERHPELNTCWEFEAECVVLFHQTTIQVNYQPVMHSLTIRQAVRILRMSTETLRTGDRGRIRFRFMYSPEYLVPGMRVIFREGRTKGVGRVVDVFPMGDPREFVTPPLVSPLDPDVGVATGATNGGDVQAASAPASLPT